MEEAFYVAAFKVGFNFLKKPFVKFFKKEPLSIDEIKKRTQIVFIDDEPLESLLVNIREAGWNVRQVNEINNFDSDELRNADIIFIDYKGVGLKLAPSEEGIGLVKAIKVKYPEKQVVFFSGYAGFIPGHEVHDIADDWIQKNSDPYVYIERIEIIAKKIYA